MRYQQKGRRILIQKETTAACRLPNHYRNNCSISFPPLTCNAHLQRAGCEHLHLRLRPDADVLFDRRVFPNVEHVAADDLPEVLPVDFPDDLLPDDLLFLAPPPLREYASLVANLLVLVSQ
jgi:hypothetical protein